MNRTDHLLTIVQEECAETAQRAAKAQRFGLLQVQEDVDDKPEENPRRENNGQRVCGEFYHLVAVLDMLGLVDVTYDGDVASLAMPAFALLEKQERVEKYFERSRRCGTLVSKEDVDSLVERLQAVKEVALGDSMATEQEFAVGEAERADSQRERDETEAALTAAIETIKKLGGIA